MSEQKRSAWLDVMKLISIFFVYVVHYSGMGRYGLFMLDALVPCFFFASGFVACTHADEAFLPFLRRKARTLVWPYLVFGGVSLAVRVFVMQMEQGEILAWLRRFLYASRSSTPVAALWFLPCLFCMSLVYHALARLVKNKWLLLGVCFCVSAAVKIIHEGPVLPWGVDMAGRFLVYYAVGDFAHTVTRGKTLRGLSLRAKAGLAIFTVCNIYVFYTHFYFGIGYFPSLLGLFEPPLLLTYAEQFLLALNTLWCVAALSMALAVFPALARAGRETLALCGAEQIIKTLAPLALAAFGLQAADAGGAVMLLQAAGMVAAAYYCIARPIARYAPFLLGRVKKP